MLTIRDTYTDHFTDSSVCLGMMKDIKACSDSLLQLLFDEVFRFYVLAFCLGPGLTQTKVLFSFQTSIAERCLTIKTLLQSM